MKRRLFLDSEVVEHLGRLRLAHRREIWRRLQEIAQTPDRFVDYLDRDERGRDLSVHVFHGYAILFWDDISDRQVKIIEISDADEFSN